MNQDRKWEIRNLPLQRDSATNWRQVRETQPQGETAEELFKPPLWDEVKMTIILTRPLTPDEIPTDDDLDYLPIG